MASETKTPTFPQISAVAFFEASSIAHVAVLVTYEPQEVEADGEQGCAQQITKSSQVRDGKTVWIFAISPHWINHPVCYTQQQQHLEEEDRFRKLAFSSNLLTLMSKIYTVHLE